MAVATGPWPEGHQWMANAPLHPSLVEFAMEFDLGRSLGNLLSNRLVAHCVKYEHLVYFYVGIT